MLFASIPKPDQVLIGRDRVSDIVRFWGLPTGAAMAAVTEVEDTRTALSNRFDFRCAIGGVGPVTMKIEDRRVALLRRGMPGDQCEAIADGNLNLSDAVQAGLRWRDAGRIGYIHEQSIAEIDRGANPGISCDKPRNERHSFPFAYPQFHQKPPLAPTLTVRRPCRRLIATMRRI
jgi:hypothetical protein